MISRLRKADVSVKNKNKNRDGIEQKASSLGRNLISSSVVVLLARGKEWGPRVWNFPSRTFTFHFFPPPTVHNLLLISFFFRGRVDHFQIKRDAAIFDQMRYKLPSSPPSSNPKFYHGTVVHYMIYLYFLAQARRRAASYRKERKLSRSKRTWWLPSRHMGWFCPKKELCHCTGIEWQSLSWSLPHKTVIFLSNFVEK